MRQDAKRQDAKRMRQTVTKKLKERGIYRIMYPTVSGVASYTFVMATAPISSNRDGWVRLIAAATARASVRNGVWPDRCDELAVAVGWMASSPLAGSVVGGVAECLAVHDASGW
jgi:hypothetical protein